MNKNYRGTLAFLLALGMAISVTACGSGAKSASLPSGGKAAEKKITIHTWTLPNQDTQPGQIKQHDAWLAKVKTKFPNVILTEDAQKPGVDYRQEYDKALMAGNAPDFWWGLPYVDVQTRIKNGTIADITDLVNNWDMKKSGKVWKAFDEALKDKNGKLYAVPHDVYIMGTNINKKNLVAGGGDMSNLPKTWNDFATTAQKATDKTKPVFGYEMVGMDWNAWPFTPWVWSAGGEMVKPNDDGTYKIAFNEEPGIDAAVYWNELVWKYQATQKDVLQDWNKLEADIEAGRTVFAWFDPQQLNNQNLQKVGLSLADFSEMKFPVKDSSIPQPTFSGGQVITINPKASKEVQKVAFEVATYITYDEDVLAEQWKIADDNKLIDATPCVRTDLTDKKMIAYAGIPAELKNFINEGAKTAKPEPYCSNWNDLKNAISKPLQQILLKKGITRVEVKKILDDCANGLYAKYPNSFKK